MTRKGPGTPFIRQVKVGDKRYRVHPGAAGQRAVIEVYRNGQWRRIPSNSREAGGVVRAMMRTVEVVRRNGNRLVTMRSRRGLLLRARLWLSRLWKRFRELL